MGQLKDAEEATKNANIRTVRSEATIFLLSATPTTSSAPAKVTDKGGKIFDAQGDFNQYIKVTTTVGKTGEVGELVFDTGAATDKATCEKSDDGYTVTITIDTKAALSGKAAGSSGS